MAYFIKFVSIDLEVALYAVSQIAAATSVLYAIVMTYLSRHGITAIFRKLNGIYDQSRDTYNNCLITPNIR